MTGIKTLIAAGVTALGLLSTPAMAAGAEGKILDHDWTFTGPFGTFDQAQLQRGFQVYREVCAGCHGMKFVPFRELMEKTKQGIGNDHGPAFSEEQMKAIAAGFDVPDEAGEPGDTRPAGLADYFPTPLASGNPPDMSLLAKARPNGSNYIYSVLLGYTGEEKEQAGSVLYENTAFPGGWISMAPPLYDEAVEYAGGGVPLTEAQYAEDLTAFLTWAAEPKMVERKAAGVRNMLFLLLFAVLLWYTNKKLWHPIKHPEDAESDGAGKA